jgi:hypothetical protein
VKPATLLLIGLVEFVEFFNHFLGLSQTLVH